MKWYVPHARLLPPVLLVCGQQAYALDDPTANVYGNSNFSYMLDYMLWEAAQGNRSVHYYPETAYWYDDHQDQGGWGCDCGGGGGVGEGWGTSAY